MADLARYVVRLEAETSRYKRGLDRANRQLDRFRRQQGRSLDHVGRQFAKLAASVGTFVSASAALRKTIDVGREFDKLNAQLKTATGSAEGAGVAFDKLEEFARRTPFALEQSVEAFVKLVNLGLTPSERALESYGNTASALGKDLTQFIEAVADASVAEFERLKEFGIKARNEGDTIRFTFRGVETEVENSAAAIEDYLIRLGEVEFAGAMQERVETLDGALSNLEDSWNALFRTLNEGPVGDWIEDQVRLGISALERLDRKIALLQGTATRTQELEEELDDLFLERQDLERELAKAAPGSNYFNALQEQIDEIIVRTERVKEALGLVKKEAASSTPKPDLLAGFGVAPQEDSGPQSSDAISSSLSKDEIRSIEEQQAAFAEGQQNIIDMRNKRREKELEALAEEQQAYADGQMAIVEHTRNRIEETERLNEQARDNFIDLFTRNMVQAADSGFDSILESWARTLVQMAAQAAASGIFDFLSSGGGGGFGQAIASFFGGGRADGGPVAAGKTYLVGERGPELFTPAASGSILANGAGGINMPVTINAPNATPGTVAQMQAYGRRWSDETIARVADLIRRGKL